MRHLLVWGHLIAIGACFPTSGIDAQTPTRTRVYLDCQGPQCDQNHYRTEITWVDWVRDTNDSHVHVIMTSQGTEAGGRQFQLDYIGTGAFSSYNAQQFYQSRSSDTQIEQLDGVAYVLALGIAQFASSNAFPPPVRIVPLASAQQGEGDEGLVAADQVDDPWNLWVLRLNGNGNLSGEETRKSHQVSGGFNASRTTLTWKTNIVGSWNTNVQKITRGDGSILTVNRENWNVSSSIVYAVARHLTVGLTGGAARVTQQNQRLQIRLNPAIEYSVFPYEESTRRALTAFLEIGPVYRGYFEETVYGRLAEYLVQSELAIGYSSRQPWGNASTSVEWSTYLHDFSKRSISLRGNMSYRITRGINLNLNGNVGWVNDQIYLSGAGLTDEERLLRLAQEATSYTYGGSIGLSWQFGSIFNNVVNNRFPGGGGPF